MGPRHCVFGVGSQTSRIDYAGLLTALLTLLFLEGIAFSVDMQPTSLALANPVSHTLNYTHFLFESQTEVIEIAHCFNFFWMGTYSMKNQCILSLLNRVEYM